MMGIGLHTTFMMGHGPERDGIHSFTAKGPLKLTLSD